MMNGDAGKKAVYRNVPDWCGFLWISLTISQLATPGLHAHRLLRDCRWQQSVEVTLEREAVGAMEVDVPECDRSNVGQDFIGRDRPTTRFSPLK
jgi:hypothetical protein